ncbi:uncharacterized protein F5891DRAFT_965218 [Suillus fuscotomentosus]|uniref:Uncharacterized protein n=1 Tax=Suillus fuscotomentosus TaxID=1912939 RepID=A0AAD4DQI0_9AGAM|nr:uncharacterized protein F5891DRAFT_965218 [Suillus fuscotomentosus]KAG1889728.1 hypothetical protein F5891DRAFT_965218 [Suillus fuscotomentosus]
MVNTRTYILPTSSASYLKFLLVFRLQLNQTLEFHVRCRLYSASWSRPRQVTMLTRCSDRSCNAKRFPVPESLLNDATVQPYVHNCLVTLHEGRRICQFCIFFKWHCHLRINTLLSSDGNVFRGDAAITRVGTSAGSVVNMRGRDNALADFIMHK